MAKVVGDDLILTQNDGDTINAGDVRGPAGASASNGDVAAFVTGAGATKSALDAGYATAQGALADAAQPADSDLTAFAALVSAANSCPYATGPGAWSLTDLTAFARTLLDDADATTALATLGIAVGGSYDDTLSFPPKMWQEGGGATAAHLTAYNTSPSTEYRWQGWLQPGVGSDVDRAIQCSGFRIPALWGSFNVKMLWVNNTAAATGTVAWRFAFGQVANAGALAGAVTIKNDPVITAAATGVLKESVLATGVPNDPAKPWSSMTVRRRGVTTAEDTLDGDTVILGVTLERAS